MLFADFCRFLDRLEKTSGRIEMTVILAEMYKQMPPEEARIATYLVQGQLGPSFANPNFGMAEKQILKVLGGEADNLFKKMGDLGSAVESYKSQVLNSKQFSEAKFQISDVFEKLLEITKVEGNGSQELKQRLLGNLAEAVSPIEAKYIVRIVLGKLRTGFSDKTILDALSWMMSGDKKNRDDFEYMYNMGADLGMVAETVIKFSNYEEIKRLRIKPNLGTPVIMAKCERAESAEEIWDRNGQCAVEYKLDGLRIQAHIQCSKSNVQCSIKLFSRGLEDMTDMFPDVVVGLKKQIKKSCIVEGEVIAVSDGGRTLAFNKTMNRKRKYDVEKMAKEIPMAIFLFDVLWVDGESVIEKGNGERWKILENMVQSNNQTKSNDQSIIRLMPRMVAQSASEIKDFFSKAIGEGMEGIVAKKLEAPYTPGSRDFAWIKMKPILDSVDVVVMGYSAGEGKRAGFGIGEFLVGVYEHKTGKYLTVSKIGSGATDAEWKRLSCELGKLTVDKKPEVYVVNKQYDQDIWVKPSLVLEVVASEISESPAHSSGYGLRFPRLVAWREKKPEDATSVEEIGKIYKMQRG